jgi:MFS family permease
VTVLAAVMSLAAADLGMIAALVPEMEAGLKIGNTQIGLLVTVAGLVSALATLPFGVLADRVPRLRMLAGAAAVWGVVELASAFAPTFMWLLGIRVLLGGVTAVAGPAIASLIGDFFPAAERGRIYGWVLAGEVVGSGAGLLLADIVSAFAGWRGALAVLSLPSIALVYFLTHGIEEPARGGSSRLQATAGENGSKDAPAAEADAHRRRIRAAARGVHAHVDERRIPSVAPRDLSLWAAVRAVLRVPTNLYLIVAGSLGYFFLNGLRTFAILFVRGQYGLNQGTASIIVLLVGVAVVAGVFIGGRNADRFVARRLTARLTVAALGFLVGAVALVAGLFAANIGLALPFFLVAGAAISEPNPPLDAARLDIMASGLWGRAESVRTAVRGVFESFAPLAFGFVSSLFAGGSGPSWGAGVNAAKATVSSAQALALRDTFLIMLVTLVGAGLLILRARRHYPTDVVSASEYESRSAGARETDHEADHDARPRSQGDRVGIDANETIGMP